MRELATLVDVDVADVHKGARLAGQLRRRDDGVAVFAYDPDYDGPGVATTLPRGRQVVAGPPGSVPPFFAGLLPEGRRLALLHLALKTSADDELPQLLAVGGDTVGDVRVVPAGEEPRSPAPRVDLATATDLDPGLLAASLGEEERGACPACSPRSRPAGRPCPSGGRHALSDAIVELEPADLPRLVANEQACLAAAAAAGLAVPDHQVLEGHDGVPALVVRRFDRVVTDGAVTAISQEDGCQVLGRWPADKYRVSTEAVVAALAGVCRAPLPAALRLWEQVAFSYLVGNNDQHAKNLSVHWGRRGWEPTPLYDVVCTFVYGDATTMALPLAGDRNPDRLRRATLLEAAESTGVRPAAMAHALDRLLARTTDLPDRIAAVEVPGVRPPKVRRYLEARRARLGVPAGR